MSVRVHAADLDDVCTVVDVAALERQPLLGAEAGQPGEHRQREPLRGELSADRFSSPTEANASTSRRFGSGFGTWQVSRRLTSIPDEDRV